MKSKILKAIVLSVFVTTLYSCYPGNDVYIEDLDTITTIFEEDDFVIAPSSVMIYWDVAQLKGEDGDDITYLGQIDDEILNTTLDNLVELYGVSNVYIYSNTTNPNPVPSNSDVTIITDPVAVPTIDAAIVPSIVLRLNTQASIIYPPCLPGWWYWWCYPPVVVVDTYSVGTVIVELIDVRDEFQERSSWTVILRGLLSSSETSNSNRTIHGIDKAFDQSPYLN